MFALEAIQVDQALWLNPVPRLAGAAGAGAMGLNVVCSKPAICSVGIST